MQLDVVTSPHPVADHAGAPNPRLARSAHEFEASLMSELLKPMQQGDGLTGDDSDGDGSGGALAGFASESLARAISEQGGFGIADRILHHFSAAKGVTATKTGPTPEVG